MNPLREPPPGQGRLTPVLSRLPKLGLLGLGILVGCNRELPSSASPAHWAYAKGAKTADAPLTPGTYHVAGSTRTYTAEQFRGHDSVDWIPEEHPAAPPIVWRRVEKGPIPCAACHYIGGQGYLSVPDLAGLPKDYIVQQVIEFRSGRRKSTEKGRFATMLMVRVANMVTDADLAQAADYFSRVPRRPWVRIVESATVPVTWPDFLGWLNESKDGGAEPIKGRVVELPEDWARTQIEDPHSGVVAYVPPGSPERGAALVRAGGNGTASCVACHGVDLKGMGTVPPLAGRSPSYVARTLWDMKSGARSGPAVALMQPVVARFSGPEITDLAAYLASLKP